MAEDIRRIGAITGGRLSSAAYASEQELGNSFHVKEQYEVGSTSPYKTQDIETLKDFLILTLSRAVLYIRKVSEKSDGGYIKVDIKGKEITDDDGIITQEQKQKLRDWLGYKIKTPVIAQQ